MKTSKFKEKNKENSPQGTQIVKFNIKKQEELKNQNIINCDFTPKFKIGSSDNFNLLQLKQNRSVREHDIMPLRCVESFEILQQIHTEKQNETSRVKK
mmetsp:Transcript_18238/g.16124  ORF Transcript_18238/g.16124 Transcript_18238/m.16124 type:complete len:98 (-) Transcript_18238:85-378(-)